MDSGGGKLRAVPVAGILFAPESPYPYGGGASAAGMDHPIAASYSMGPGEHAAGYLAS